MLQGSLFMGFLNRRRVRLLMFVLMLEDGLADWYCDEWGEVLDCVLFMIFFFKNRTS